MHMGGNGPHLTLREAESVSKVQSSIHIGVGKSDKILLLPENTTTKTWLNHNFKHNKSRSEIQSV